ncbi:prepilin peptidase [Guggenheimella bovis]
MDSLCFFITLGISIEDLKSKTIPNEWVALLALVNVFRTNNFISAIISFLIAVLIYFLFYGKLGFGDVKLLFALVLWKGSPLEIVAFSFLSAGLLSIVLLIFKVLDRKSSIPFGPFLCLGALLI